MNSTAPLKKQDSFSNLPLLKSPTSPLTDSEVETPNTSAKNNCDGGDGDIAKQSSQDLNEKAKLASFMDELKKDFPLKEPQFKDIEKIEIIHLPEPDDKSGSNDEKIIEKNIVEADHEDPEDDEGERLIENNDVKNDNNKVTEISPSTGDSRAKQTAKVHPINEKLLVSESKSKIEEYNKERNQTPGGDIEKTKDKCIEIFKSNEFENMVNIDETKRKEKKKIKKNLTSLKESKTIKFNVKLILFLDYR